MQLTNTSTYLSIHSVNFIRLSRVSLMYLYPSNVQLLLGYSEVFRGQMGYTSPAGFGSALGSPPSWICPKTSRKRCPGGILIKCLNHLSSFRDKETAALLRALSRCLILLTLSHPPYGGNSFWMHVSAILFSLSLSKAHHNR